MHKSSTQYLGLDVHTDSINITVADAPREAEVRHLGSVPGARAGHAEDGTFDATSRLAGVPALDHQERRAGGSAGQAAGT